MNERLQDLLDHVQRTACEVGDAAAETVCGVGKKAGTLLSVAKLNVKIMELEGEVRDALQDVGSMIYSTHTGHPTDSELLLQKLQEIDGYHSRIDALREEAERLREQGSCPVCGAARQEGDLFCRECGGKF